MSSIQLFEKLCWTELNAIIEYLQGPIDNTDFLVSLREISQDFKRQLENPRFGVLFRYSDRWRTLHNIQLSAQMLAQFPIISHVRVRRSNLLTFKNVHTQRLDVYDVRNDTDDKLDFSSFQTVVHLGIYIFVTSESLPMIELPPQLQYFVLSSHSFVPSQAFQTHKQSHFFLCAKIFESLLSPLKVKLCLFQTIKLCCLDCKSVANILCKLESSGRAAVRHLSLKINDFEKEWRLDVSSCENLQTIHIGFLDNCDTLVKQYEGDFQQRVKRCFPYYILYLCTSTSNVNVNCTNPKAIVICHTAMTAASFANLKRETKHRIWSENQQPIANPLTWRRQLAKRKKI